MTSVLVVVCIAVACFSSSNADTVNVKGKLTCHGRPFETTVITVNAFVKGSAGLNIQSGPGKLDYQDKEKAAEINGLVTLETVDSGSDGIFLFGYEEYELNTNAAPVLFLFNDCPTKRACWMRDLPITSINAKKPYDLGTIELSKLPANFKVVNCWDNK